MFGKPSWFRPKTIGWGLKPVTWQGWAYTLIWAGVLLLPFLALLKAHLGPEAMIWLVASMGLLGFDVWHIRRSMIPPVVAKPQGAQGNNGIWFVGEEKPATPLATRNYDLKLKR